MVGFWAFKPVSNANILLLCRSPLKHHMERQKKTFRTEWLNTPNAYKKEEFDEIGTPNPKKITKVKYYWQFMHFTSINV